jgi:hypothetical protein
MIQFPCSECGKKLNVGESAAGKLATCPTCKAKTRVPQESAEEDPPKKSARSPKDAVTAKKSPPPEVDEEEELEPVDEEMEEEEEERPQRKKGIQARRRQDEDEEEEEPRRKKLVKSRRDDDEDEDEDGEEDDRSGFTANRIRGVVALVMAVVIIVFGLTFEKFKDPLVEYGQYGTPVCCVIGGLLAVSGIYYLIRG